MMRPRPFIAAMFGLALAAGGPLLARQEEPVPHGQDRPPNPALSPAEAVAAMTVPEGFAVELVASEPDLINPVAMTFDEKGRVWVTESLEYPRKEPGPGRDRVKVLEDTTGDGRADRVTVFADGLNIPSGIAVGHGGVWVANSPDILFYPNADGDLTPDGPPEVVVTGFGRADTHELPNSLTWGPDGWLYGWNGVFNPSRVEHDGTVFEFTCAIFRIHPVTRKFELFCEGTSNPWGIAIDPEGSLFASACVIDHLWHLVETGYYHRQGGPYPPFTWKIESIVEHRHYKAAYCGIHYFDSPAYPPEFRDTLYMGNIHGNSINVDSLSRDGSTYRGHEGPDFLKANDAWFMPVVQKTGPDGSLYVLDWYDRYHCYQDANRDPEGIDRLKGRLYRVRYGDTPRRSGFDLAASSDEELVGLLGNPNVYDRDVAQRLLTERLLDGRAGPDTSDRLEALVLDAETPQKARMHGLWVLVSAGPLPVDFHRELFFHDDPVVNAWAVRAAGTMGTVDEDILRQVALASTVDDPRVKLQAAIALPKLEGSRPIHDFVHILGNCGDDELIPRVVWRNLHPMLEADGKEFLRTLTRDDGFDLEGAPALAEVVARSIDRVLGGRSPDVEVASGLLRELIDSGEVPATRQALGLLANRLRDRSLPESVADDLRGRIVDLLGPRLAEDRAADPIGPDAAILLSYCGSPEGLDAARRLVRSARESEDLRVRAFEALVFGEEPGALRAVAEAALDGSEIEGPPGFRAHVLGALGETNDPGLAATILDAYDDLDPDLRPRAVELLTQRPAWTRALLEAVGRGAIPANALNVTQILKLQSSPDAEVVRLVQQTWGTVRAGRDPAREQVIDRMKGHLDRAGGDPYAGRLVFNRVCAQCHPIYGQGETVGPDLSGVGRDSYEQLLSNVFDPSLVIGAAYQATIVATSDGRILTGLLEEDGEQRIVLKIQGGQREVIPRDEVDEIAVADVSLMPENLEEQLTPEELADLFSFLCLDRAPEDPEARPIDGIPRGLIAPRPAAGSSEGSQE